MKNTIICLRCLVLFCALSGCSTVAYKMTVPGVSSRWTEDAKGTRNEVIARVKSALRASEFSQFLRIDTNDDIIIDSYVYDGLYEGVWPFGSRYQEKLVVTIKVLSMAENAQKVEIVGIAKSRLNAYWSWGDCSESNNFNTEFNKVLATISNL